MKEIQEYKNFNTLFNKFRQLNINSLLVNNNKKKLKKQDI